MEGQLLVQATLAVALPALLAGGVSFAVSVGCLLWWLLQKRALPMGLGVWIVPMPWLLGVAAVLATPGDVPAAARVSAGHFALALALAGPICVWLAGGVVVSFLEKRDQWLWPYGLVALLAPAVVLGSGVLIGDFVFPTLRAVMYVAAALLITASLGRRPEGVAANASTLLTSAFPVIVALGEVAYLGVAQLMLCNNKPNDPENYAKYVELVSHVLDTASWMGAVAVGASLPFVGLVLWARKREGAPPVTWLALVPGAVAPVVPLIARISDEALVEGLHAIAAWQVGG